MNLPFLVSFLSARPPAHLGRLGLLSCLLTIGSALPISLHAASFGAKFESPAGQIYSGAGQSPIAIMQMTNKGSQSRKPMIVAAYDSLDDTTTYAPGQSLYEAHNYYPGAKLQVGLSLPINNLAELQKVSDGTYDVKIMQLAQFYKTLPHDVFLRVGYEFDGIWNSYDPTAYIAAFRRVVDIFAEQAVDNVAFVWNASAPNAANYQNWYPGDAYVDWWSFNFWNATNASSFFAAAAARGKPVLVGESSKQNTAFSTTWFTNYFDSIKAQTSSNEIKGYQYINWWWDTTDAWTWGDSRYTAVPAWTTAWNTEMQNPRYLHRGSSYYNPCGVFVQPGRGYLNKSPNPDIDGQPWSAANDESAANSGYGYSFVNAVHRDTLGWAPHVKEGPGGNEIQIPFTVPAGSQGLIALQTYGAHTLKIGNRTLYTNQQRLRVKYPYTAADIVGGKVTVSLTRTGSSALLVFWAGVQRIKSSAPAAPAGLAVTGRTASSLTTSWTAVAGATHYNVYRDGTWVGVTPTNSFLDRGLNAATTYAYSVSAWHGQNGEGAHTAPVSGTTWVYRDTLGNLTTATSRSANLVIDATTPRLHEGDVGRAKRTTQTTEWLKYNVSALTAAAVRVDYNNSASDNLRLYASATDGSYVLLTATKDTPVPVGGGWYRTHYRVDALPAGTNWLMVEIPANSFAPWTPQIREVSLNY